MPSWCRPPSPFGGDMGRARGRRAFHPFASASDRPWPDRRRCGTKWYCPDPGSTLFWRQPARMDRAHEGSDRTGAGVPGTLVWPEALIVLAGAYAVATGVTTLVGWAADIPRL